MKTHLTLASTLLAAAALAGCGRARPSDNDTNITPAEIFEDSTTVIVTEESLPAVNEIGDAIDQTTQQAAPAAAKAAATAATTPTPAAFHKEAMTRHATAKAAPHKETLGEAVDSLGQAASNTAAAVGEKGVQVYDKSRDAVTHAAEATADKSVEVYDKSRDAVKNAAEKTAEKTTNVLNSIKEAL